MNKKNLKCPIPPELPKTINYVYDGNELTPEIRRLNKAFNKEAKISNTRIINQFLTEYKRFYDDYKKYINQIEEDETLDSEEVLALQERIQQEDQEEYDRIRAELEEEEANKNN